MKVCKFGGSSLRDASRFKAAAQIMLADKERRICVLSAPGVGTDGESKITDLLIKLASSQSFTQNRELVNLIEFRFHKIAEELGINPQHIINGQNIKERLWDEEFNLQVERYDALIALGEIFSASLMAAYLKKSGYAANYLDAGEAGLRVTRGKRYYHVEESSRALLRTKLSQALENQEFIVIPGFYGIDKLGKRRPLSRGGSDVSAAWIASSLEADCEIWTDVSGVYDSDPRLVSDAQPVSSLSFKEMLALAKFGAQVLHPEAIKPMQESPKTLYIKNSFQADLPGTRLQQSPPTPRPGVLALSIKTGVNPVQIFAEAEEPLPKNFRKEENIALLSLVAEGIEENVELITEIEKSLREVDSHIYHLENIQTQACLLFAVPQNLALESLLLMRKLYLN